MKAIPEDILRAFVKPVAVLGMGVSGQAVISLLRRLGTRYKTYDAKGLAGAKQTFDAADAAQAGVVVYSPGFAQNHPWLECARRQGCICLAELDLGAMLWPGSLIAVTGTNGKSTLTELLSQAFQKAGFRAIAAGNIGYPLCAAFEQTNPKDLIAVCEVSSYQAEALRYFKPMAMLWTNLAEDHLDRYGSLRAYFEAKWRLVSLLQRPRLVVGQSVCDQAKALGYTVPAYAKVAMRGQGTVPEGSVFESYPQEENYWVAYEYWKQEGLPLQSLQAAAQSFKPLQHRLQKVATIKGVTYWNDSKATNFVSSIAACRTFPRPIYWIGGGKSKGGDIESFVGDISPSVRHAWVLGEVAPLLESYFKAKGVGVTMVSSLQAAVEQAYAVTKSGDNVVLSPGFPSLDMFEDYADRGNCFQRAVLGLKCG